MAQLGDREIQNLPPVELTLPIAVALIRPLSTALAVTGTAQGISFRTHQGIGRKQITFDYVCDDRLVRWGRDPSGDLQDARPRCQQCRGGLADAAASTILIYCCSIGWGRRLRLDRSISAMRGRPGERQ